MPRTESEQLAHRGDVAVRDLKCPSCSAVGQLVPESSSEFAEFANDLVFSSYAAKLQEAGYEVLAYSAQCDHRDHRHCDGKNRLAGEIPPPFERCSCPCHEPYGKEQRLPIEGNISDMEERLRNRVDENAVGKILQAIALTPNRRNKPRADDLTGNFDFWFDGGASRMITGWTEFEFADGTRARVDVVPGLHVVIQFKSGYGVDISQLDPEFDIGGMFPKR